MFLFFLIIRLRLREIIFCYCEGNIYIFYFFNICFMQIFFKDVLSQLFGIIKGMVYIKFYEGYLQNIL